MPRDPGQRDEALHRPSVRRDRCDRGRVCALALDRGWIPPTLNWENPDPACDLDVVPQHGRDCEIDHVLSNSFGFGGINACIVLGRVPTG